MLPYNTHETAKKYVQQTYFNYTDSELPLFVFIGRITEQKGVHLILDTFESVLSSKHKVQLLIGGMASEEDPYGRYCIYKMNQLKSQYPKYFWVCFLPVELIPNRQIHLISLQMDSFVTSLLILVWCPLCLSHLVLSSMSSSLQAPLLLLSKQEAWLYLLFILHSSFFRRRSTSGIQDQRLETASCLLITPLTLSRLQWKEPLVCLRIQKRMLVVLQLIK